tara:strand:+ start:466 stop:2160 length:1695 start_codon:yes stop_codon:yes gene_type:complete
MINKIKSARLFRQFERNIKPTQNVDIVEWAGKNVYLGHSNCFVDLDYTPYFAEPLRAFASGDYKEINIKAPTGAGKTVFLETLLAYIISIDSGNVIYSLHNNNMATDWSNTNLKKVLQQSPATKDIISLCGQHDYKKDMIMLPHMYISIGGANEGNLQSRSVRYTINDEVWRFASGMLEQSRKRTHDKWNSCVINVSQAGNVGDDFDVACDDGDTHDLQWHCTKCKKHNQWSMDNMAWTSKKDTLGRYLWKPTLGSIHMTCPECDAKYENTPNNRQSLMQGSQYISRDNNCVPDHITFTFPALAIAKISWEVIVRQFLEANRDMKKGDITKLQLFNQQRMAQSWINNQDFEIDATKHKIATGNYTMDEAKEKFKGEIKRFMCADVQGENQRYFWATIRARFPNGESKLCWAGMLDSYASVRAKELEYGVDQLFIDCAFEQDEVLSKASQFRWIGLDGREIKNLFNHKEGKKLHSKVQKFKNAFFYTFASEQCKDVVARLRDGIGASFEVPLDINKTEYIKHMFGEVKKEVSPNVYKWVKRSSTRNDLFDTECMQVVASHLYKVN